MKTTLTAKLKEDGSYEATLTRTVTISGLKYLKYNLKSYNLKIKIRKPTIHGKNGYIYAE